MQEELENNINDRTDVYLSRDSGGFNPGKTYIRVALVAPKDDMQRGLTSLRDCLYG